MRLPRRGAPGALASAALLVVMITPVAAQQSAPACAADSLFAALDFWVGEWSRQVSGASRDCAPA